MSSATRSPHSASSISWMWCCLRLRAVGVVVVLATEWGAGRGRPARVGFRAALHRLRAERARAVFVGDDPRTDIEGAAAAGMKTIHMMGNIGHDARCGAPACRIHV